MTSAAPTPSNTQCASLKPCLNNGNCTAIDNESLYNCSCVSHVEGYHCEHDYRLCKSDTCWNNGNHSSSFFINNIVTLGSCQVISDRTFTCMCAPGWKGERCGQMINYCHNITCQNRGVCQSSLLNYSCQCLSGYFGDHCENTTNTLLVRQAAAKSLAYIAIIAMALAVTFVVIMDILKYCFGIDSVEGERERIRRDRRAKKCKPVIQRLIYAEIS